MLLEQASTSPAPPPVPVGRRIARATAVVVGIALLAALVVWVAQALVGSGKAPPARQVAKISLLPDTPPPPPPPPPKERPPEPRDTPKPAAAEPEPAEVPQPANEPIKMEGAAGDGPSPFAAGTVDKEYSGGAPQIGASQPAATAIDRAQERLYTNGVRQQLRDAVERHLKSDAVEATAVFSVWLDREGAIRRFELVPSGDPQLDLALNQALDETVRALRLPPPPAHFTASTAMRFRLTLRPLG